MQEKTCAWTRPAKVQCDGKSLRVVGGANDNSYHPFDIQNLPNALAKVIDTRSAVRFTRAYGLLGYGRLLGADGRTVDEPLDWVLQHARGTDFALKLIEALYREDVEALRGELDRQSLMLFATETRQVPNETEGRLDLKRRRSAPPAPEHAEAGQNASPIYDLIIRTSREGVAFSDDGQTPSDVIRNRAQSIIEHLVNGNTRGVRQMLRSENGRVVFRRCFDGLIEAIWYIVGEISVKVQEGSAIRRCEECGTPFLVTDERQRFCPPQYWSRTSLCGAKQRMRMQRQGGSQ